MGIIFSPDFVVSSSVEAGYEDVTADNPVIGYDNVVSASTITATYEDVSYPITNIANPATHLVWKPTSLATQYITVPIPADHTVQFMGIARHNFGTLQTSLKV